MYLRNIFEKKLHKNILRYPNQWHHKYENRKDIFESVFMSIKFFVQEMEYDKSSSDNKYLSNLDSNIESEYREKNIFRSIEYSSKKSSKTKSVKESETKNQ